MTPSDMQTLDVSGQRRRFTLTGRAGLEVPLALVAMGLALSHAGGGHDWLFAIPVLLGVVHGFGAALCGALLLVALGPLRNQHPWLAQQLAGLPQPSLTWPLLALLIGEVRDQLRAHQLRAQRGERAAKQALEQLARAHELVQSSHARLALEQGCEAWTLSAGVRELERAGAAGAPLRSLADSLLGLCASYAGATRAAVYLGTHRSALEHPVACYGQTERGHAGPLAEAALRDGELVTLLDVDPRNRGGVAALPLLDVGGEVRGVLVIDAVPLGRLHRRELTLLRALAGKLADIVAGRTHSDVRELAPSRTHSDVRELAPAPRMERPAALRDARDTQPIPLMRPKPATLPPLQQPLTAAAQRARLPALPPPTRASAAAQKQAS